ncbi:AraC family transcriptional regulator [Streptomyces subrutilus]|uniref:AraC family transcriptional regulator n=1 Tax=Streptomyces subrutilus TaxID=36818 RepID=A0A5P2UVL5_9ACTN|nr:AraC family transcriptional regulator [Streptomyces subrutilus]QEU82265.1 AraC family transcriptional regulator [Streptomyces subrutilus]GGZ99749.1 AraC family transcriptional regulator [Streptomyces subrutilus]
MNDALTALLQDVRARGAVFDQSALVPPWSLRFADPGPLGVLTMLSGNAWLRPDGGEPTPLNRGDVAIVVGPQPYTVADSPDTAPVAIVGEHGICAIPGGSRITADELAMCATGTTTAETILLRSSYPVRGRVSDRVLTSLPRVALVPAGPERSLPLAMIEAELRKDAPGRQALLDRLLDTLLITTLRDWFDRSEAGAPAWYRAHGDPAVGHALKLIHTEPARPWTVASLAAETGMSRARFALRFADLVGQPPMTYLTEWRLCRAADLLSDTDATLDAIARQVGYSNAYTLSVAFKRASGIRPSEHRAAARSVRSPAHGPH